MVTSVLNPNAPMFVPSAYRAVEDFSDQWWSLVQSSPWFRDYWIQECFSDQEFDSPFLDLVGDEFQIGDAVTEAKEGGRDLVALASLKWGKPRRAAEMPRYGDKPPKTVNVRVRPRPIQQPR